MRHVISVLLQNEVGALTRLTGMFSTRGYNIESLNVAPTNDPTVSRLTVVTSGSDAALAQIVRQTAKLIDVVSIHDMTSFEHFERELLLMKLRVTSGAYAALAELTERAGARVLDYAQTSYTVELTAEPEAVDEFIEAAGGHAEILAVVRTGSLAVNRGERVLTEDLGRLLAG